MTQESLEQAQRLKQSIIEVEEYIKTVKPYVGQRTKVTIERDDDGKKKISKILTSDDPLLIAICATLEDMRSELCKQFDDLDCQSTEEPNNPIKKTTANIKTWINGGLCKFRKIFY